MDNKSLQGELSFTTKGSAARSIESLKRYAKQLKKAQGITHAEALDAVAKTKGFAHWGALMKASRK